MKPTICFLTNLENDGLDEDLFLISQLRNALHVIVCHPIDYSALKCSVDVVLLRNIWPMNDYLAEFEVFAERIAKDKTPIYNSLDGKGDRRGKSYLCALYEEGFPVVPTFSSPINLPESLKNRELFVKPIFGCDGENCSRVNASAIYKTWKEGFIVQPFEHIREELGLYFIDGKFAYAIKELDKLAESGATEYDPRPHELKFAERFVHWNSLKCGIQRVDILRLQSGDLLLGEIEDLCPYLYLLELSPRLREHILERITNSFQRVMTNNMTTHHTCG